MKKLLNLLILSLLLSACGSKPPKSATAETGKAESVKNEAAQAAPLSGPIMWKIASYSGDLGDNKNSNYMTNTITIWGTYSNSTVDNSELKVKFLIDKVSFCLKLYEGGNKIVQKGDETSYKVAVKTEDNEVFQFTAKNVSDRIFINEAEVKKIVELFDKDGKITFSLVNDSKTNPSSYAFALDHPGGFSDILKKLFN